MKKVLGKLFGGGESRRERNDLARYETGVAACEQCGTQIALDGLEPLTLAHCPKCGDVIFIPWLLEEWWVTRPLAAGGFGAVYSGCFRGNPDQRVVVKVLQRGDHIQEHDVALFEHECDIAYELEPHPNLPETYAVGEQDDALFMVQEFIEGQNLNALVEQQGPVMPEAALYYAMDVIYALQHILQAGYVYRDVKPENIIIRPDHTACLIDLGNCTALADAEVADEQAALVGSPLYMAPERYLKQGDDFRADIYSLGMVLFYAIMGENFFDQDEVKRVAKGHTRNVRLPTKSKMRECREELAGLVDGMIRRKPEERFASYDELLTALVNVIPLYVQIKIKDPGLRWRREQFLQQYAG